MADLARALAERYRIERELGHGGMATVYLAEDLRHKRRVAVKVLKPELAAVLGAERFVQEITTTAALQHPHILPLFDSGTADGFLYYVMPYVQGETLRARLDRETQLGIEEAVRITREVADALDYAHRHGVIHRDIKPENILLHDGRPMVADFGIALAVSAAAGGRMTETGLSLGTPHYMSPEQATAEKELTYRSDIYSLGCVLYEMLTGSPPHVGATAQQIVMKIVMDEARPVPELRKSVPPHVAAATSKALEKLPADRFESAKAFADALGNPAFGAGLRQGGPPGARAIAGRPDWRITLAGGILLGVLGGWLAFGGADSAAHAVDRRAQLTFNGRSELPAISPDGRHVAWVEERCSDGPSGGCRTSLLAMERAVHRAITVIDDALGIGAPKFSPDGQLLYFAAALDSSRSGLFAVPRFGGLPRRVTEAGPFDVHGGGDTLVVVQVHGGRLAAKFVLAATGAVVDSVRMPGGSHDWPVADIAWSPDGGRLVFTYTYRQLNVMRRDGTVTDSVREPFRATVRWMPDGRGVLVFRALQGIEDDLWFVPVSRAGRLGRHEVVLTKVPSLTQGMFDLARGDATLALVTGQSTHDLWTFELSAAGSARRATSGTTWYGGPAISPDGRTLYYQRGDISGDNLYRLRLPGQEEQLTADSVPSGFYGVEVSRDGRRALFGQSFGTGVRIRLMDLATSQSATAPYVGPDGRDPLPIGRGIADQLPDGRGLSIADSLGGTRREWVLPDSLEGSHWAFGPGEASVAFLLHTRQDETWLATSPLSQWRPRLLYRFAPDEEPGRHLAWGEDGWISLDLEKPGRQAAVWGIRAEGGTLTRRAPLPEACRWRWTRLATAAPIGVCIAVDRRPDVWVIEIPRLRAMTP
jgi:tRNA A-37 threonylcarbamoyl transferase component Bud32